MTVDIEIIARIVEGVLGAVAAAMLGFIVWLIKKLIDAVMNNSIAVIKLTAKIEEFEKIVEPLPKMRGDLNALHTKVRNLETKTEGL